MRARITSVLILGVLGVLLVPAAASAAVVFTGPTFFTGGEPPASTTWLIEATGATVESPPGDYYDPDGALTGSANFTDAHNAQGMFDPNLPSMGRQFAWFSKASTVIEGDALFMVNRLYEAAVAAPFVPLSDSFVVYRLDFAGDHYLTGEYYSCGPAAFAENKGANKDFYYEGRVGIAKQGTPGGVPEPAASTELYGYYGIIGGESPLCDEARSHPELFTPFDGSGSTSPTNPGSDTRRSTQTAVTCNRGPNPGDPFSCSVTVGDTDTRSGARIPTGTVDLSASSGTLNTASCQLTPSTSDPPRALSTCGPFQYVNADLGAGNRPPIAAVYRGSSVHKGSKGDTSSELPTAPVVCGPAPLPACEGQVPPPQPVETCVGNVGGACTNPSRQPPPVQTCAANVIGACTLFPNQSQLVICVLNGATGCPAFTTGAQLAGVWNPASSTAEVTVSCAASGASARQRDPDNGDGIVLPGEGGEKDVSPASCSIRLNMTADEKLVVDLFDAAFRGEVGARAAIAREIADAKKKEPIGIGRFPNKFTVDEVISKSLRATVQNHNRRIFVVNDVVQRFTKKRRAELLIGILKPIDLNQRLGAFDASATHPADGKRYNTPKPGKPQMRAGAARKKPKVVNSGGPSRKGLKTKQFGVGSTTVKLPYGKRGLVKVKLTQVAQALLELSSVAGKTSLPLTTTVSVSSPSNAFKTATKTAKTTVKLATPKKPKK